MVDFDKKQVPDGVFREKSHGWTARSGATGGKILRTWLPNDYSRRFDAGVLSCVLSPKAIHKGLNLLCDQVVVFGGGNLYFDEPAGPGAAFFYQAEAVDIGRLTIVTSSACAGLVNRVNKAA